MATKSKEKRTITAVSFLAGAISGTLSTAMFQPLDLIKTRMQAGTMKASPVVSNVGMMNTLFSIIRNERFPALWKGLIPSLQRCVPGIGVYFASLTTLKTSFVGSPDQNISPFEALIIGVVSRGIAVFSLLPITVVKARYESGIYTYKSVPQAVKSIWIHEGVRGLYSGLSATLARDVPFSAIYYLLYSQSTQSLKQLTNTSHLNPMYVLSCGCVSGVCASFITQPFDVVKTRLQIGTSHNQGIMSIMMSIVNKDGMKYLFSGLTPRVIRRTLMAAFTWMFYEEIYQTVYKYYIN